MRVGLIGFGHVAERAHLPAWLASAGSEIVALADIAPERCARARVLVPKARIYGSADELLDHEALDVLDICSPPNTHADFVVAACERGIPHIICEKPLTVSEAEFIRIAQAWAAGGSRIVTVNNWLYSDLHRLVNEALATGMIGDITTVTLRTFRPDCALGTECWQPRWRTDRSIAGGGIILDHGWHQLSLMLAWLGDGVEHVQACVDTRDARHAPVEDQATIDVFFPRSWGRIELSWAAAVRSNSGLIEGTTGRIVIGDDRIIVKHAGGYSERLYSGRLSASSYHPDWFEAFFHQTVLTPDRRGADRNFVQTALITGILAAAYRSAADSGQPQHVTLMEEIAPLLPIETAIAQID
jgi:predicted dehydrogenase